MFGSFHIELNILDIFGRLIEGSGGPFVLSEGKIIAPGSIVRFLKGKPYIDAEELIYSYLLHSKDYISELCEEVQYK